MDRVIQIGFNGNLPVSLRKVGWDDGPLFLEDDEFLAVVSVFMVAWVSWALDLEPLWRIIWSYMDLPLQLVNLNVSKLNLIWYN